MYEMIGVVIAWVLLTTAALWAGLVLYTYAEDWLSDKTRGWTDKIVIPLIKIEMRSHERVPTGLLVSFLMICAAIFAERFWPLILVSVIVIGVMFKVRSNRRKLKTMEV